MNIIEVHQTTMTKEDCVKALGIISFDYAVPQNWIDEVVLHIRLNDKSIEDPYGLILSNVVWCYDGSMFGFPYAFTQRVYDLLQKDYIPRGSRTWAAQPNVLKFVTPMGGYDETVC